MKTFKKVFGKQTSLICSNDPETIYAFVTNLATECMFMNPFHIISCPDKNKAVSPSGVGSDTLIKIQIYKYYSLLKW